MIIKLLKGRSFGGLLDYLFDPQDKPPPMEIETRGSPENQSIEQEPPPTREHKSETGKAGQGEERSQDDSTEGKQREDRDESGKIQREQRGELLITNMSGRSKEELLEHFEALAALRPDVEVNVLHCILSLPEEDVLSPDTKVRLVQRFVRLKGLDQTMFAAVEHKEDGHRHTEIHIVASTITFKGKLSSDSFDYDKGEAVARQLEREFNLKPNKSSRESMARAPTQGEWKQHERTGQLSPPLRLQALVNSALDREITFTELQKRLERRSVALRLIVNGEGYVAGSIYEFEGKHIRGRRLGRGYTWPGLQRDWPDQQERKGRMTYEPERDHEAFSYAGSGEVGRRRTVAPRGHERFVVRTVGGNGEVPQRVERAAVPHRNPSHQTHPVGEESRRAIRDNRASGEGTARGNGGTQEGHHDQSHRVHRAGHNDRRPNQRGVSASTRNTPGVLRRDAEDQRQERADGRAVPGHGGDKQRHLPQGQRGSSGVVEENAGALKGRRRGALQGDRGAGAAIRDDLPAVEQVDHHQDDSDPPVRVRHGNNGRGNVVLHEAASGRRDASLELSGADNSKKDGDVHSRTSLDTLTIDGEPKSRHASAVDEVIKTLWSDPSSSEDIAGHSTAGPNQKGHANEMGYYPQQRGLSAPGEVTKREEPRLKPRDWLEMVRDQSDSSQPQRSSHERQDNDKEQSRRGGGREPSR